MNSLWERLNEREQRLTIATAGVVCLALAVMVGVRAAGYLHELDRTIARLEQDIVNYAEQEARGVSVSKAYAGVAAQHSSAWTEAEIHNRLRQEIYRLALEDPEGSPDSPNKLVEIPTLRQGALRDTGHGYREYQLSIKIPQTDIYSLALFLIRLQASPQSLRIDGLDIARSPDGPLIGANINVTRTVVAGSPDEAEAGSPEMPSGDPAALAYVANWDGTDAAGWEGDSCDMAPSPTVGSLVADGGSCLKLAAGKPDATAYMRQELEPKTTYELSVQVAAEKPVLIMIADAKGTRYEGTVDVPGDGRCRRYKLAFTTGGDKDKVKLGAPVILFKDGGTAYVDNVLLKKAID
ncbi:MAG TPA: hypothetical protein PKO36_04825 [Candidatus Hydrogenedentes bacterium]|nr:hypothetical protein [Candidatus Hydrogenedentota bacterium]HOT50855.1 hypothetical protein [Candidatus Hydrogenedentota bacterium]HOV75056.1 hypothetical protein [Candidatus Hydrogenedentota bacterium]HPC15219.1 hypothetical protein [Candidatus Hydrogenedentota bacterium]HRT19526.1 hypothetical protein [Candidatus Hydrogenedentota bacterium]